ncbi:hypothetical protein HN51_062442 [Arachis hypogaea]
MSSPFLSCFRPSHTCRNCPPPPAPPGPSNPNLTTYLYHTDTGLVTLTWSRSILGRSLHVHVHNHNPFDSPPPYKALYILEEARIQNPLFHHASLLEPLQSQVLFLLLPRTPLLLLPRSRRPQPHRSPPRQFPQRRLLQVQGSLR